MVMSREKAARILAEHFGTTPRYVGGTYAAWKVPDGQGRQWLLERDSSIEASDEHKCEFVTPICRWEDIETVQELIRKLRAAGEGAQLLRDPCAHRAGRPHPANPPESGEHRQRT